MDNSQSLSDDDDSHTLLMSNLDFDDMLLELGELGRYQIIMYTLACIPVLFGAANSLTYVFTAGIPNYRCLVPECDSLSDPVYNTHWLEWAIPSNGKSATEYEPRYCERYVSNITTNIHPECSSNMFTNQTERCYEWVFDNERSIVNDWNITCLENQWMLSFVGTSHFAGIIVGSGAFGALADRYGRKLMFILSIVIMSISGIVQVFSNGYIMFVILIFINAVGTAGIFPLAFIIGVEMVGRKKREVTGMILNYFYAVGEALIALIAWMTKDWVQLQLIASAPALIFVGYYWILPESVRWLLAKHRNVEAKAIVYRVAKYNNVALSEELQESFQEVNCKVETEAEEVEILPVIVSMSKSRKLVIRFIIVFFIWAVNAFVFYGLSLNATSIGGDKYLNFALVCLVEIPGYSLAWICINKLGRKWSLAGSLLISGITCCLTIWVPADMHWAVILLFLIGKLGVTSAFSVSYVHTSEMLPTIIRSGGVGFASTTARVGALVAPFVPLLGQYVPFLPMLLLGGFAIVAGLLALKLPETRGIKLPERVVDAQRL